MRESFSIAGAFDDDLVAGVGQPVEGAAAEDGVVKETEPLVDGTVAGDYEAGRPVPVEDEFIQIGGLLRGEAVQPQVVEDEQVGCQEGVIHRVVDPGLGQGFEEVGGVAEADGVSGADGRVAQCLWCWP